MKSTKSHRHKQLPLCNPTWWATDLCPPRWRVLRSIFLVSLSVRNEPPADHWEHLCIIVNELYALLAARGTGWQSRTSG